MNSPAGQPSLSLPPTDLKVRPRPGGDSLQVYDRLRKKWVALTPEENVRQRFTAYLIDNLGYPEGRMGNEIALELNGRPRRCDTVIYGHDARPLAIVEYKAPEVSVTSRAFEQIMRYSIALGTRWIIVTNGLRHYCGHIVPGQPPTCRFLDHIPSYSELAST